MSLDIAIMAMVGVPERRADLISVQRRLAPHVAIVIPGSKATTLWDSARKGWLNVLGGRASHGLVLQEDMLPSLNFVQAAKEALEQRPDAPVCFFTSRRKSIVEPAKNAGKAWAVTPDAAWGGAVAMPKDLIADFLRWEIANVSPTYPHDDGRISLWAMVTGRQIWVTVPSLLEHVGATRSVQGYGGGINRNRVAAWYVDDAYGVDWAAGANDPVISKGTYGPVTRRELERIRLTG